MSMNSRSVGADRVAGDLAEGDDDDLRARAGEVLQRLGEVAPVAGEDDQPAQPVAVRPDGDVVEHVLVDVVVGLALRPGEHREAEAAQRLHPALQRARLTAGCWRRRRPRRRRRPAADGIPGALDEPGGDRVEPRARGSAVGPGPDDRGQGHVDVRRVPDEQVQRRPLAPAGCRPAGSGSRRRWQRCRARQQSAASASRGTAPARAVAAPRARRGRPAGAARDPRADRSAGVEPPAASGGDRRSAATAASAQQVAAGGLDPPHPAGDLLGRHRRARGASPGRGRSRPRAPSAGAPAVSTPSATDRMPRVRVSADDRAPARPRSPRPPPARRR